MTEVLESPMEVEFVVVEGALKLSNELAPEQRAENVHVYEESSPTPHPPVAVEAEPATRDDAV